MVTTLRNQTNSNAHVFIYDIVTKRDPPSTLLDAPYEAWDKGILDMGGPPLYTVGTTPARSPEFNQYFAINKVTRLHMEPGMEHVHTVHHGYQKPVSSVRFQNIPGTAAAGLTRYVMIVAYGTLVADRGDVGPPTTGTVELEYITRREISFGFLEKTTPLYTTLGTPLAQTVADPTFMGEAGDVELSLGSA